MNISTDLSNYVDPAGEIISYSPLIFHLYFSDDCLVEVIWDSPLRGTPSPERYIAAEYARPALNGAGFPTRPNDLQRGVTDVD